MNYVVCSMIVQLQEVLKLVLQIKKQSIEGMN